MKKMFLLVLCSLFILTTQGFSYRTDVLELRIKSESRNTAERNQLKTNIQKIKDELVQQNQDLIKAENKGDSKAISEITAKINDLITQCNTYRILLKKFPAESSKYKKDGNFPKRTQRKSFFS